MPPGTYKEDAIVGLFEADDDTLTSAEVGNHMPAAPTDPSTVMKRLHDDGYVDREGDGVRGDPYRYTLTGKGEAAAKDLIDDVDVDEDTGLDALFDAEDDFDDDDYVSLPMNADDGDVDKGVRYRAHINNVEDFGVFVSLNHAEDDVTGLVHKSKFPDDYEPTDFAEGDHIGVMLADHSDRGLDFEMVAAFDTVRGVEFERHPTVAPEAEPEEPDEPVESEDEPEPPERDAFEERIADIERAVQDKANQVDTDHLRNDVDSAFGELSEAYDRIRSIEDALSGADHTVALTDEELVDAVYLIANADAERASYRRRTDLIARLIGADPGDGVNDHPDESACEMTSEDDAAPDADGGA